MSESYEVTNVHKGRARDGKGSQVAQEAPSCQESGGGVGADEGEFDADSYNCGVLDASFTTRLGEFLKKAGL